MARMFVDCRDHPSEMNCMVAIFRGYQERTFRGSRSARGDASKTSEAVWACGIN